MMRFRKVGEDRTESAPGESHAGGRNKMLRGWRLGFASVIYFLPKASRAR